MEFPPLDRSVLRVVSMYDESEDKAFWKSKTPLERLQVLEMLRQMNYGYDPDTARVQRVLEVVKRT